MLSDKISSLKGSPTAKFFALAKQREAEGHDIIHLEIGQPDFSPLESIIVSTSDALTQGKTTYTVSSGIPELRNRVAKYYNNDFGIEIDPLKEIIITSGAKQAIIASFFALLDRNDSIIVSEPYWVSYPDMARLTGAKFVPIAMTPDFSLNQDEILEKISNNKTKALLVNSPNNPSGHILSKSEISFLKDISQDHDIYIISDEIYNEYNYINNPVRTLLTEFQDWREKLIVINGFAKTFSMTGYRLGWVVANKEIYQGILRFIQANTSCPTSFAQWGGVTALENIDQARKVINEKFPKRRELLLEEVEKTPGLHLDQIDGAFYGFIRYEMNIPSEKLAEDILTKANVCLIPGTAFGQSAENHLRVTFSRSSSEIKEAFTRIRNYLKN
ncbi:MAG: pyridoxal phosphate-dependent aminotransferase [Candidatus Hodarchaeales archaeon]